MRQNQSNLIALIIAIVLHAILLNFEYYFFIPYGLSMSLKMEEYEELFYVIFPILTLLISLFVIKKLMKQMFK